MPDGEDDEEAMRTIATLGRENAALRARLGALADEAERLAGMVARLAKERDATRADLEAIRESLRSRKGTPEEGRLSIRDIARLKAAIQRTAGLEPES